MPDDYDSLVAPKLRQVLDDKVPATSPYSKYHFVQFLLRSHCVENLDFYCDVSKLLEHSSLSQWATIYDDYIKREIINLPCALVDQTHRSSIPDKRVLVRMCRHAREYLHLSYHAFIEETVRECTVCDSDDSSQSGTATSTTAATSPMSGENCYCFVPQRGDSENSANTHHHHSHSHSHHQAARDANSWGKLSKRFKWRRSSSSSSAAS